MNHQQLNFNQIRGDAASRILAIQANRNPIALLLDHVQDTRNIGGLFRLADAARLEQLYFYPALFDKTSKKLTKVARSTNKYIKTSILQQQVDINHLQAHYQLIALEKTTTSICYAQFQPQMNKPILLVVGSEKFGVSPPLLDAVEAALHIPMLGVNTSMNVNAATSIVVYSLLEKLGTFDTLVT